MPSQVDPTPIQSTFTVIGNGEIPITAASCNAETAFPININDSANKRYVVVEKKRAIGNFTEYLNIPHAIIDNTAIPNKSPPITNEY